MRLTASRVAWGDESHAHANLTLCPCRTRRYNAEAEINQLQWSGSHPDWVGIAFNTKVRASLFFQMRLATNDLIGEFCVPNCPRCARPQMPVVRAWSDANIARVADRAGPGGVGGSRLAWGRATALEARGAAGTRAVLARSEPDARCARGVKLTTARPRLLYTDASPPTSI